MSRAKDFEAIQDKTNKVKCTLACACALLMKASDTCGLAEVARVERVLTDILEELDLLEESLDHFSLGHLTSRVVRSDGAQAAV